MSLTRPMAAPMILLWLASACAGQPQVSTVEACSAATDAGAREKYTFESIVPCLSDPQLVSDFVASNIAYDPEYDLRERSGNEYVPARLVYERGIDDSDGHAILQCFLLEQNGWDALVLGLSIERPVGSNVCAVEQPDGSILVLEGAGKLAGPFPSLAAVSEEYVGRGWMESGGTIRSLKPSQVGQVATDRTSPSVMELPWSLLSE